MPGRKLVRLLQLTFTLVHCLTSLLFLRLQRNTEALVRERPPDCHRAVYSRIQVDMAGHLTIQYSTI